MYLLKDTSCFFQVYCHAMMSQEPKEYITLRTGPANNFAEIYAKR